MTSQGHFFCKFFVKNEIKKNKIKCVQSSFKLSQTYSLTMDVLLNEPSILAKRELQSLCCMMEKTMSLQYHLLTANGWRLND